MSDIAIRCEGLGKRYRIGGYEHSKHLRDTLTHAMSAPFRRVRSAFQGGGKLAAGIDTFWALKDVSFEVKHGEVVGVIGRNGAGKSTLLKILSRITEPTAGRAKIQGRVGSLLEVGTGFHPDLTGRENIYLNGAILGMKRAEIRRKFDEIVDFAEVEKFIDTPVKHYSSGMYLRLAFAVAAHLEPEVLMVDEVLAVGDVSFQEKCLGKMGKVAKEGRTVLFVSHNLSAVQHLCNRAMLLRLGNVKALGSTLDIIGHYLSDAADEHQVSISEWHDRETTGEARLVEIEVCNGQGTLSNRIPVGGDIGFILCAEFYQPVVDPTFGVIIHNSLGEPILDVRSSHSGFRPGRVSGRVAIHARIEKLGLYPGRYFISPWISDAAVTRNIDYVRLCCALQVDPAPGPLGDLKLDPLYGKYWVQSDWQANGRHS
jgi:lipopolysaccharide transport system ATP-binding protein